MTQSRTTARSPQLAEAAPPGGAPRPRGDNTPQPIRSLRDWLDHLARNDRLALVKPDVDLRHALAAYAKRLDGKRATLFPRPGGHAMPVISGLVSNRGWIAEAMGVEPPEVLERFQEAALNPLPGARCAPRRRRRWSIARSTWRNCCPCRPTTNTTADPILGRPDDRPQPRDG